MAAIAWSRVQRGAYSQVKGWLDPKMKQRLDALLRRRGLRFGDWLRQTIDRQYAERLPESQGDVKRVIPSAVAVLAAETLAEKGQFLMERSTRTKAGDRRLTLRDEAKPYLDAASWFDAVEDDRSFREHLLESGQAKARHRPTAAHPLQVLPNPAVASLSATKDRPTG